MDLYKNTMAEIEAIADIHSAAETSVPQDTTAREQRVLDSIDVLIKHAGITGLYPLKALLMASNNWHSFRIVRDSLFRDILLEGVEQGALAPDDDEGWAWMAAAAQSNDPTGFINDTDRYFDMLMTATEHGNDDAHDIMDMIWEPENCIEED